MNAIIQSLNFYVGLLSFIVASFVAIISARSISRVKIGEEANKAQQRLLNTMKDEIASLRRKVDDTAKDNSRLHHTIQTIVAALKKRGIMVTIDGDMVNIADGNGKASTTVRIQEDRM